MTIVFSPYKNGRLGVLTLRKVFAERNVKCIERKAVNSKRSVKKSDLEVLWGYKQVTGKIDQYHAFSSFGVPCPEFTTNEHQALAWITDGHKVVCRKLNNSSGGDGIILASTEDEFVAGCPVYTKFITFRAEFRAYVAQTNDRNELIHVKQKLRKPKDQRDENYNPYIRNHQFGWIFAEVPEKFDRFATELTATWIAHDAVDSVSDWTALKDNQVAIFGVDIGAEYDEPTDEITWRVLEVNSSIGLDNSTANLIADYLTSIAA